VARVLVVDDSSDIRWALRDLLENAGHEVIEAADGAEAVERALAEGPDLLLLDIGLPRFDGMEVLRRLKSYARTSSVPVIVITAADERVHMQRSLAMGACGFIGKPWRDNDVESQVAWALDAAERERAGKPLPDGWAPIRGRLLVG